MSNDMTRLANSNLADPFDPVPADQRGVDARGFELNTAARWLAGYDEPAGRNYTVPVRPYRTEPWIRKAIALIAASGASVPMMVTTLDGDIIADGPLVEFLGSPVVRDGPRGLVANYLGHYLLSAEAHLVFGLRSPRENTVDCFGAYNMTALVSDDGYELRGWEAWIKDQKGRRQKYPLEAKSVASWIDFSLYPDTRFRGLSRLESLALTLAEAESASEHNATLLARGGGPKGVLKTEQTLTVEQANQLEQRWASKYDGRGNTGKTAVLGRGTEWSPIAQSNRELMIIESRKIDRETILSLFDIPLEVAGIGSDKGSTGKANSSAREGFWVNTVWPLMNAVGENFTKAFVPRFGDRLGRKMFTRTAGKAYLGADYRAAVARAPRGADVIVWFDMHQIPALRAWHWSQADTIKTLTDIGIPLNEAIEKLDLPFTSDKAWGDTWWVKPGLIPAEIAMRNAENPPEPAPAPGSPGKPDDENPEEDPKPSADDKAKSAKLLADSGEVWRQYVRSWEGLETSTRIDVEKYWFGQRSRILARLDAMAGKSGVPTDTKEYTDALPDIITENELIVQVMEPHLREGMLLGGKQVASEVAGQNPFAMDDLYFQRFLPERFAKLQMTVNQTTFNDLREIMSAAQQSGEGMTALADRVKGYFKGQIDTGRSLTIARTESAMSLSQGRAETMRVNGVQGKGWLSAMDEHTRATHAAAGVRYGDKGIPIGDQFDVGGERMDHPNDPKGSADNVINCRCVLIVLQVGKTWRETIDEYLARGFVKWERKAG